MDEPELSDHAFLDGRLILREPRRGHRSGTDAILLAAASRVRAGQHVVDVGAGAGAAALAVLRRVDEATATLIECHPAMAALARYNIEVNGLADRASVVEVNLFDRSACRAAFARPADVVISNPPFYVEGTVRASPHSQKAGSHVLSRRGHEDWLRELLVLASPKRRVVLIHRPDAIPALLMTAAGRASVRLRAVHPRMDSEAHRVLMEFVPGRRSPLVMEPPLVLHRDDGRFTPFTEDLHRGRAEL